MQTQLMDDCDAGVPWLEHYPDGDGTPERTPLKTLPFSIGRVESADLQVKSTRVSREHAEIVKQGNQYVIRDLKSTNGTMVNGEPISETALNSGDIVVIADAEFTFVAGQPRQSAATQRMDGGATAPDRRPPASAGIDAVRRMHELLLRRGFDLQLTPIVSIEDRSTFAYEAFASDTAYELIDGRLRAVPLSIGCHLTQRMRELYRIVAVEQFLHRAGSHLLFLGVDAVEILGESELTAHLGRLRDLAAEMLVVALPAVEVCDLPYAAAFRERLEAVGIPVAYRDFQGRRSQINEFATCPPDYLMLSASMTRNICERRHHRQQLNDVLESCEELQCQVIASGLESKEDEAVCRELGVTLISEQQAGTERTPEVSMEVCPA